MRYAGAGHAACLLVIIVNAQAGLHHHVTVEVSVVTLLVYGNTDYTV